MGRGNRRSSSTGDVVLEVAVDLIAEHGYHATTMREIAMASEIQPAGIYHWYKSKESILVELQNAFMADLTLEVLRATDGEMPVEAKLAAAVCAHVRFHGLHARAAFATDSEIRALSPENRAALIAKRDAYQARFVDWIDDGIRSGAFVELDARVASYAILLACTGVAMWFDPSGRLSLDEVAEMHAALALRSLGVEQAAVESTISATQHATI